VSRDIDALVKKLFEPGDFTLNPERSEEFLGCKVFSCAHANEPIDRVVWYHFIHTERGPVAMKMCVACTKDAIAASDYPPIVCRVPKIILDYKAMKDVIRSGRMEAISDSGKKLEEEVLGESAEKDGVN
jgi:hypothetical protein